jgi:hypothetical protein
MRQRYIIPKTYSSNTQNKNNPVFKDSSGNTNTNSPFTIGRDLSGSASVIINHFHNCKFDHVPESTNFGIKRKIGKNYDGK